MWWVVVRCVVRGVVRDVVRGVVRDAIVCIIRKVIRADNESVMIQ